ncbi:hypothetical protein FLAG1_06928 [Fusarium langsethiae]|uniref:Uncharacterized protein n=1 Tax=Fusarium langsethiae TaxID=179993 RepID=A0A0N0V693_FUSLA|nr:hypothetical protein FLAG1_06928 [Fusarium langsethiae]GKU04380.1 unnamed protein product [Fusarium langsethiae]GKU19680.1 unnamed protein product [Fusarium langsethiae]
MAGLDDDNQLATTARPTCLRLTDKDTQYDRYNPVSVFIVYNLLGDSSQANTIDPATQLSGIAHPAPVLDPFTQTDRQPEADKAREARFKRDYKAFKKSQQGE